MDGVLNERSQRSSLFGDPASVAAFTIWFRELAGTPPLGPVPVEDREPFFIPRTTTVEEAIAQIT